MRGYRLIPVLVLAAIVLLASYALAGEDEGTKELTMGDHISVHIDNSEGGALEITIEAEVIEGFNVNAYLLDEDNYEAYQAGEDFEEWEGYSKEDTDEVDKTFVFASKGNFYVVIDSTATGVNETTTVKYFVSWDNAYDFGFNWLWCIAAAVIVIIITATLAFMHRSGGPDEGPQ